MDFILRNVPRWRIVVLFAGLLVLLPELARAGSGSGEFQVNSFTTARQAYAAVTMNDDGEFVVAWMSYGSGGSDSGISSYGSIQAAIYDARGNLTQGQFQVNSFTTDIQYYPDVAFDAAGNFLVVWVSFGSGGSDTSSNSVQAQGFDSIGTPLGVEFQVNTYTTSSQGRPAVAGDGLGNMVVVWQSDGSANDNSGTSIQLQRYAASGSDIGAALQVNEYTTGGQAVADVSIGAAGNYVVVWQSFGSPGTDDSNRSIQARRFAASGSPIGGQFQVNTYTTDFQVNPSVAVGRRGSFLVVWGSMGSAGDDSSEMSIQAQRYDFQGDPAGDQFQVNSLTTGRQNAPVVSSNRQGDFVVSWYSYSSNGSDDDGASVQMRRFDSQGVPRDTEIQVNAYGLGDQWWPALASDPNGSVVVAWASDGSNGTDDSDSSIQANFYCGIFCDGFETGTASQWAGVIR